MKLNQNSRILQRWQSNDQHMTPILGYFYHSLSQHSTQGVPVYLTIERQWVSQQVTLRLLQVWRVRKRDVENAERCSRPGRHSFPEAVLDQRLRRVGIPSCSQVCKRWVWVKRPRERRPGIHGNLRQNEVIPVAEGKRGLTQGAKHVVQFARVASR